MPHFDISTNMLQIHNLRNTQADPPRRDTMFPLLSWDGPNTEL